MGGEDRRPKVGEDFLAARLRMAKVMPSSPDVRLMEKPKIVAYLKPWCGWSNGVRAVMKKYELPFEDRDIINDPVNRAEMIEKSGQTLSPCVEINGRMLPDISGEEVEAWMLKEGLVRPNDVVPEVPTNQPCAHEIPTASPLGFRRPI